jgi:hypothetical protein
MIDGSEMVEREEGIPARKECPVIESCGPNIFSGIRNLFIQEINSETVSRVSADSMKTALNLSKIPACIDFSL